MPIFTTVVALNYFVPIFLIVFALVPLTTVAQVYVEEKYFGWGEYNEFMTHNWGGYYCGKCKVS